MCSDSCSLLQLLRSESIQCQLSGSAWHSVLDAVTEVFRLKANILCELPEITLAMSQKNVQNEIKIEWRTNKILQIREMHKVTVYPINWKQKKQIERAVDDFWKFRNESKYSKCIEAIQKLVHILLCGYQQKPNLNEDEQRFLRGLSF